MPIPKSRQASDMDLKTSMLMGIDECHIAFKEAYSDLADDQFHSYSIEGRHNIATIVVHCLQQHDEFNGNLQERRGIPAKFGWQSIEHEERFLLWGVPVDKLPKPGDDFPEVARVLAAHNELHSHIVENMTALSEDDFVSTSVGQWPRLCDMFFRGTYHVNAHIRQIWLLRGAMGVLARFPEQHYA
jgi:hypothetical protein